MLLTYLILAAVTELAQAGGQLLPAGGQHVHLDTRWHRGYLLVEPVPRAISNATSPTSQGRVGTGSGLSIRPTCST